MFALDCFARELALQLPYFQSQNSVPTSIKLRGAGFTSACLCSHCLNVSHSEKKLHIGTEMRFLSFIKYERTELALSSDCSGLAALLTPRGSWQFSPGKARCAPGSVKVSAAHMRAAHTAVHGSGVSSQQLHGGMGRNSAST